MSSNEILWFGAVFKENELHNFKAISPAGNNWQLRFIESIIKNRTYNVVCFGHLPYQSFPKGKLYVPKNCDIELSYIKQFLASYLNLPFIRNIFINLSILFSLINYLKENNKKSFTVISYNIYSYNFLPILFAKVLFHFKIYTIVADPLNDKTDRINPLTFFADGKIFLSRKLYQDSKSIRKVNIEGGIVLNEFETNKPIPFRYLLYAGRVSVLNGVKLLLDAFELIDDENLFLIITGFNDDASVLEDILNAKNVIYKGMISNSELKLLFQNALILINPRLTKISTNDSVFPSKLLEYLSYRKPVISTYTLGIPTEYKNIVNFIYNDSPEELKLEIVKILNWTDNDLLEYSLKVHDFILTEKSWDIVTKKLLNFLKS